MKKHNLLIACVLCIGVSPLIAFSAPAPPDAGIITKYADLFSWMFGVGLFVLCSLVAMLIHVGNKNNEKQWKKLDAHDTDIGNLKSDVSNIKGRIYSK